MAAPPASHRHQPPTPAVGQTAAAPLLALDGVAVHYPARTALLARHSSAIVKAVDGVGLSMARGECLGLVGESGCGKSTLARAILRLQPVTAGTIVFQGHPWNRLTERELRPLRPDVQMVFQDPGASLNPRLNVFATLAEAVAVRGVYSRPDRGAAVAELLSLTGLQPADSAKYPHEFSGGQRQRIAIARALATNPALIVADEPVASLDVSVQAQILNLFSQLRQDRHLSLLFISHDLPAVHHLADRIAVMYLGKIVETGPATEVYLRPRHPYTRALLAAHPPPDPDRAGHFRRFIATGEPPIGQSVPTGCAFHSRCPFAVEKCRLYPAPPLTSAGSSHAVACWRSAELPSWP